MELPVKKPINWVVKCIYSCNDPKHYPGIIQLISLLTAKLDREGFPDATHYCEDLVELAKIKCHCYDTTTQSSSKSTSP